MVLPMASPLICKLNPLSPIVEGPSGAFLPAPVGAGSAPTPERARLALRTFEKSTSPCPLWSTPSAGRCTSQNGIALEFRALALPRAGLLRLRCSFPETPSWLLVPGPLTLAGWGIENLAVDACPARHLVYQTQRQKQAPAPSVEWFLICRTGRAIVKASHRRRPCPQVPCCKPLT